MDAPTPTRWRVPSVGDVGLAALVGCAAALVALRTMVAGGFAAVPGDFEDGRLNAFLLEHSWGFLAGARGHQSFWGLPAFYPVGDNALAFGDAMFSFGFLYWPWRAAGLAPDTSYQAWVLSVVAANVLACHLFLRFAVGASHPAAALGAWLGACSASRLHQMSHSQLQPCFFVVAALAGALAWVRAETAWVRRTALVVVFASIVLQLYGGFYMGLFAALLIATVTAISCTMTQPRRLLLERLRLDWAWLLGFAVTAALALGPWLAHYGAAHRLVGARGWEEVASMLPRPASWLFAPPNALAYSWTRRLSFFDDLPRSFGQAIGLGFFTTALTLSAAVACRRDTAVRMTAGATALLVGLVTVFPGGVSIWGWVVALAPPLAAARAVSRIGLLLPLAAAVILTAAIARARTRPARAALLAGLALAGGEQLGRVRLHDKASSRREVAAIVRRVDPGASAFVVTTRRRSPGATRLQVSAMWAASHAGVPTVNGHSGSFPRGWEPLKKLRVRERARRDALRSSLDAWLRSQGAAAGTVQWIELSQGRRPVTRGERGLAGR